MTKKRPKCELCPNTSVMVDYQLDRVNCTAGIDLTKAPNNWTGGSSVQHDKYCEFPKPVFFCWEHWGIEWPFEDNYPWYETISTWAENIRPAKHGFRSPAQLRNMYAPRRTSGMQQMFSDQTS